MSFSVALPHEALKAFGYGLEALNKFGDEVNIDAKKEQLILWTVNSSITGQVVLRMSPKLFEKYTIRPSADTGSTTTSCRLLLKTLLKVFKSNQHRSSSIKQCELKLNGGPATSRTTGGLNGPEHRLYLKFMYENGMTKTNSLWYTDTDISRPLFSKNLPYSFIIDPGVFFDCIALMDNRIQDLSFLFTPSRVIIKTFWDPSIGNNSNRPMQSQFKIPSHDFTYYNVNTELVLTFSMKEFKTAVTYGIDTCDMLHAQFEEPGKPLIFTVEQRGFVIADFALMTFASNEGITQSSGLTMNNNSITTENSSKNKNENFRQMCCFLL
ncbi:Rad9/Ddc1 [Absidia repens]|uniref:Rad9/Ddc1 n=1 Tax=Absidia repens TaxID=90262 RepID=A0A1X2IXF0_9FUNG|nr:Rad9/Ddc1 [Absidia repens]